jgi:hypothetical protein
MKLNDHFIIGLQNFTYAHPGPKLLCEIEDYMSHLAPADYSKAFS